MARRQQQAGVWQSARLVDMGGGLVTAVAPDLLNDNEAQVSDYVDYSQKGTIRPDVTLKARYATPFSSSPVQGIGRYYKADGSSYLMLYSGGTVYYDKPHLVRTFDAKEDWDTGTFARAESTSSPGDIKLVAGPVATFSRPLTGSVAQESVNWSYGVYGSMWRAQSVTLSERSRIESCQLYVAKVGSPPSAIVVELRSSLTGQALASASRPPSDVGTAAAWISFTFASPPTVDPGAYYIVVHTTGGDSSNAYTWRSSSLNPYAGGMYYASSDSGQRWSSNASYDFCFRLYYSDGCAYKSDGTKVSGPDTPRFEPGKFGQALMVEEGTQNLLSATDSQGFTSSVNVTVTNGTTYTVSMYGTGSITLSGAGAGTVTASSPVTFTASGTTLTLIPTGSTGRVQVEAKPYKTTWQIGGTPRAPELSTIPTAGVFTPGNWTIEFNFKPTSSPAAGVFRRLWHCYIDANNEWGIVIHPDGKPYLSIKSNGTTYESIGTVSAMQIDTWYAIAASGNGTTARFFVNGLKVAEFSYVEPVGTPPASIYLGKRAGIEFYANGLFDDPRISSIARTDSEISAAYTSGQPLPVDEYTTAKFSFDNTLQGGIGGYWVSPWIDISNVTDGTSGVVTWDGTTPAGTSVTIKTRTSADMTTATQWVPVTAQGNIQSPANKYLQVQVAMGMNATTSPSVGALTVVYDSQPAVTALLSGLPSTADAYFATFRDLLIMANGANPVKKWTGTGSMADLGGSPPTARYVEVFQNRLWLANTTTDHSRIWFSDLLLPESWPALNYIDIQPDDGDEIKGLRLIGDTLVIFKERSTHILYGDSPENFAVKCIFPNIGCVAPRGHGQLGPFLVFVSDDGVRFSDLADQKLASERIEPSWQELNPRRIHEVLVASSDNMLYVVGPSGTATYNNRAFVFDEIRKCWSEKSNFTVRCAVEFREAGHRKLLFGDSTVGQVWTIEGPPGPMKWESKSFTFGSPETVKVFRRVFLNVRDPGTPGTLKIYARVDLGALKGPVTLNLLGDGQLHTLMVRLSDMGIGYGRSLSVQIQAGSPSTRFEVHSVTFEYMLVAVRV